MDNHLLYVSWSAIGFYLTIILCICLLLFFTGNMLKKDSRILDIFTNILIILGAIAWVVITS